MEPIILSRELLDIFPELGTGDKLEDEGLDGPKCGEGPGTLPGLGTDSMELEGDGPVGPGLGTDSMELEGAGPISPGLGTDSIGVVEFVEVVLLVKVLLLEVFVYIVALEQTTIL